MTYTHTGMCHTMSYDRPISTAPLVLRLKESSGQRLSLMMHDPRFNLIHMVQSLWITLMTPENDPW